MAFCSECGTMYLACLSEFGIEIKSRIESNRSKYEKFGRKLPRSLFLATFFLETTFRLCFMIVLFPVFYFLRLRFGISLFCYFELTAWLDRFFGDSLRGGQRDSL